LDWVDDAYDEVLNPPIYGQHVFISVTQRKVENRSSICAAYKKWGKAARSRRARVAQLVVGDTSSKAPPRPTEMDLDRFCSK
jgi:hypothetical protein